MNDGHNRNIKLQNYCGVCMYNSNEDKTNAMYNLLSTENTEKHHLKVYKDCNRSVYCWNYSHII